MKLLVKRERINKSEIENIDTNVSSITEIPSGTITWLSVIYIFINIIATSIAEYIGKSPQMINDNKSFELKDQNFRVQLLQRALELEDSTDREASLKLLMAAGLLNKEVKLFVDSNTVPKWSKRTIEPLNSYLFLGSAVSSGPESLNISRTSQLSNSIQKLPEVSLGSIPKDSIK
jgi:hypothetical protein